MNIIKEEKANNQKKVIWIKINNKFVKYEFKYDENYSELVKYFKNQKKSKNQKNDKLEKKALNTLKFIKKQILKNTKDEDITKNKKTKNIKKSGVEVGRHINVLDIEKHYSGGFPGFFDKNKISGNLINSYVFENANKISKDLMTIQNFLLKNSEELGIEGFSKIKVTSGYRDIKYQGELHRNSQNAAKHSSHTWGGGADIKFVGVGDKKRFRIFIIISKLMEYDKINKGFINVYNNDKHIHIDNLQQITVPKKYYYKKSVLDNLTLNGFKNISKFKTKKVNTNRSNTFNLLRSKESTIGGAYEKSKSKVKDWEDLEKKLDDILGETASNVNTNKKQDKIVKTSNSQMFASINANYNQSADIEFN